MMPHIRPSVSHASRDRREIYLAQPVDGVCELRVAQPEPHDAAPHAHRTDALGRHAQFPRQGRHRGGAVGGAGDDGSPLRLAEQQLDSRQSQAVSGEIDLQAEARLVVRAAYRHLGERDAQAALRSEEHTSELQSLTNLVCRLLLEKKNTWWGGSFNVIDQDVDRTVGVFSGYDLGDVSTDAP